MSNDITIKIPDNVKNLMQRVLNFGYEIYVVGGCVRDTLRHRIVADYDLTTNALPIDIIGIFSDCNVIETGLQHGTVTVVFNNEMFEITTFRIDGEYTDNRHPDTVTFTNSLFEDLSRRDFTINAMAADIDGNVIDFFDGISDLEKKIIRCVGNPYNRFNEDALRILRAFRFAVKIGGSIEPNTARAMFQNSRLLTNIAEERIQKELNGFLVGRNNDATADDIIKCVHVLNLVIPQLNLLLTEIFDADYPEVVALVHAAKVTACIDSDITLKLAALFHDIGKEHSRCIIDGEEKFPYHAIESARVAKEILEKLRYPNEVVNNVVWLIKHHEESLALNKTAIKKLLRQAPSIDVFRKLTKLMLANETVKTKSKASAVLNYAALAEEIIENKEAFNLKHLAVTGYDMMRIGYKDKGVGEALERALDAVINEIIINDRDAILNYLKGVDL